MKKLILILFILSSLSSLGKSNIFELINQGDSLTSLVPNGWKILTYSYGDLNNDGIDDLALIIQGTDSTKIKLCDGFSVDTIDLNPRILAIYFKNSQTNKFEKQLQSDSFILIREEPAMDDPFDTIEISNDGILKIDFHIFYNVGSWFMSRNSYKFRFQNNEFELIGYDSDEVIRNSGETTNYSINFSAKKICIKKGSISEDKPKSVKWKKFNLKKLKTIESLGKPFNWNFIGLNL
jgi:hypothetical protein